MDFGSMNIQLVVPKIPEVSQLQHTMTQQGAVHQAVETMRQKADDQLKDMQVRAKEQAEDGRIKGDSERESSGYGGGGSSGRRQPEEEEPAEKMAVDTFRGHNIDIKF